MSAQKAKETALEANISPDLEAQLNAARDFLNTFSLSSAREKSEFFIKNLTQYSTDIDTMLAATLLEIMPLLDKHAAVLEEQFGSGVVGILTAIQKHREFTALAVQNPQNQPELLRKIFFVLAGDLRVVWIVLMERLHLLRNSHGIEKKVLEQYAREVLNLFAPIAARLGLYELKNELEDRAFAILFPEERSKMLQQLKKMHYADSEFLVLGKKQLADALPTIFSKGEIQGRAKEPYSIFRKVRRKDFSRLSDIPDIFAFRIIVPTLEDCYTVLGHIHRTWQFLPERFKDYIAQPKFNGYQSLHTTLTNFFPKLRRVFVEVQIRTPQMHEQSERGFAVHWRYKEGTDKAKQLEKNWFATLAQSTRDREDEDNFLTFARDFLGEQVLVLTEQGDIKVLPKNATPIDFAYSVHTDVGNHAQGAIINGKIAPLYSKLQNGDVVKIITHPQVSPKMAWLQFVAAPTTRQKIRSFFRKQDKEFFIRKGKEELNNALTALSSDHLDGNLSQLKLYGDNGELNFKDREHILHRIGIGDFSPYLVAKKIGEKREGFFSFRSKITPLPHNAEKKEVLVAGEKGFSFRLPKCCQPEWGQEIMAFTTRGGGFTIHRKNCRMLEKLDPERILPAMWKNEK